MAKYNKDKKMTKDAQESRSKSVDKRESADSRGTQTRPRTNPRGGITLADLLTANAELTRAAANISWDYPANQAKLIDAARITGNPPTGQTSNIVFKYPSTQYINGAICNIRWMPTFGTSVNPYSPLNITARATESFIRAQNSRSRSYDASDLMMHTVAADSLFLFFIMMRRIYRTIRMYDMLDYGQPDMLLRAMGVDASDMRSHIMDLWGYMSEYAQRLSTVALPGSMSVVSIHQFLTDNIFKDADVAQKAEMYVFNPSGFWQYVEDEVPTRLKYHTWYQTSLTKFSRLVQFGDELWESWSRVEDLATINADVLHAYGTGAMSVVTMPSPDEVLLPVYNEDLIDAIQNMTWYGKVFEKSLDGLPQNEVRPSIKQVVDENLNSYLTFLPCVRSYSNAPTRLRRYSFMGDEFSPKQLMLSALLSSGSASAPVVLTDTSPSDSPIEYQLDDCSVVLPENVILLYHDAMRYSASTGHVHVDDTFANGAEVMVKESATGYTLKDIIQAFAIMDQFKRHPEVSLQLYTDTSYERSGKGTVFMSELRNFTFLDVEMQHKLHRAALISMMNTASAAVGR